MNYQKRKELQKALLITHISVNLVADANSATLRNLQRRVYRPIVLLGLTQDLKIKGASRAFCRSSLERRSSNATSFQNERSFDLIQSEDISQTVVFLFYRKIVISRFFSPFVVVF